MKVVKTVSKLLGKLVPQLLIYGEQPGCKLMNPYLRLVDVNRRVVQMFIAKVEI